MKPKFRDLRPTFASSSFYAVPNESITTLTEMVKKAAPKRSAGICSSGEVPLFVLLPHSETVTAVDHSYDSLRMGITKALLLEHHTTAEIKTLLNEPTTAPTSATSGRQGGKFVDACAAVQAEIPTAVPPSRQGMWIDYGAISRLWKTIPDATFDAARERLENLTFLHGDLRDLGKPRKFDLLYTSNAMEHTGHDGNSPKLKDFSPAIKRRKFILCATMSTRLGVNEPAWIQTEITTKNPTVGGEMYWRYALLQNAPPLKKKTEATKLKLD